MKVHASEILASVEHVGLGANGQLIDNINEKGVEAVYYPNGIKFVIWTTDKRHRQIQKEILIPWDDAKAFAQAIVDKCDWMESRSKE